MATVWTLEPDLHTFRLFGGRIRNVRDAERRLRGGFAADPKCKLCLVAGIEREHPTKLACKWHGEAFESLNALFVFGVLGESDDLMFHFQ